MSTQGFRATRTITPRQLYELAESGETVEVIDVRTPPEYRSGHLPMARSQPLSSLDPKAIVSARGNAGGPLYVVCRSGHRSKQACAAFAAAGYGDRVVNVQGGTTAWQKAGLPLEGEGGDPSTGRQAVLAVAILVLLGAVLGYLFNPWF